MVLMVNHIFEASNEFSKQVNGFDFKIICEKQINNGFDLFNHI